MPNPPRTAAEPLAAKKNPSRLSISAALLETEKEEEKSEAPAPESLPKSHFTQTDLDGIWEKYLKSLQEEDIIAFNAVNTFKLTKTGEDRIEIRFPSASAKQEFERIRTDFLNHLMHKVNHYSLTLEFKNDVTLKKEVVTKRKIFDKFAEINPVLRDLDDVFKFDFN